MLYNGADINQIPGALIQRVEVLTGGSSATYGSDAVAGVVNFIMRKMKGVEISLVPQVGALLKSERSNGRSKLAAGTQKRPARVTGHQRWRDGRLFEQPRGSDIRHPVVRRRTFAR